MRIEQPHQLGCEGAIARVDEFLERLVQDPPRGATVRDVRKTWDGPRMTFAFGLSWGLFGTSFSGTLEVTDDRVVLDSELPSIVRSLVGEERIRQAIADHLGRVLK